MKYCFFLISILLSFNVFSMAEYLKCTPSKWKHGHIQVYNHLYQHQQKYSKHKFFRFFLSELAKERHKEQGIKYLYFLYHKERDLKAKNYYNKIAADLYKVNLAQSKFYEIKNTKRLKKLSVEQIKSLCQNKLDNINS